MPAVSPDGQWLAYAAMKRPGYEADRLVLTLRNIATGETRALTEGWDRSVGSIAWAADGQSLLVTANDVLDNPVFRVDATSGKVTRLTQAGHVSAVVPTPKGAVVAINSLTAPDDFYAVAATGKGKPARLTVPRDPEEERLFAQAQLLTSKPVLYVCNVEEESAATGNAHSARVFEKAAAENAKAVIVSAAIEAELITMPVEERAEYLEALGLTEAGLARIIRAGYELLGLITFFTVGPKEARAWTVAKGSKAPQAAGAIHTDFEKGFIRAETMAYADYVQYKGEAGAKEAGKWRSEGKDYVTQDGDIMLFRFNV